MEDLGERSQVPAARVTASAAGVPDIAAEQMLAAADTGDPAVMLGALSDIGSLLSPQAREEAEARHSAAWAVPPGLVAAAYGAMEPVVLPEASPQLLSLSARTDRELVLVASVMTCWLPPEALHPALDEARGWSRLVRAVYLQTLLCLSGHAGYAGEYSFDAFRSMGVNLAVPGALDELRKWADGQDSAFAGSQVDVPDSCAVLALESAVALAAAVDEALRPVSELLRRETAAELLPSVAAGLSGIQSQLADLQEAASMTAAGVGPYSGPMRRIRRRLEDRRAVLEDRWRDFRAVQEITAAMPTVDSDPAAADRLTARLAEIAESADLILHQGAAGRPQDDPYASEAALLRAAAEQYRSPQLAAALQAAGLGGRLSLPEPSPLETSAHRL